MKRLVLIDIFHIPSHHSLEHSHLFMLFTCWILTWIKTLSPEQKPGLDGVLAQECVCWAAAAPPCCHCNTTNSSCRRGRCRQGKAPIPGTTSSDTGLAKSFGAGSISSAEKAVGLRCTLCTSPPIHPLKVLLGVQKNCSHSFPSVFIQILVPHGTETVKDPHQQSV